MCFDKLPLELLLSIPALPILLIKFAKTCDTAVNDMQEGKGLQSSIKNLVCFYKGTRPILLGDRNVSLSVMDTLADILILRSVPMQRFVVYHGAMLVAE
jgi:hypothetical protein